MLPVFFHPVLTTNRKSEYPINDIILHRWSPRAMTGESIDDATLMSFFEAARWAPSSMNNQLIRFVYTKKDSSYWQEYFGLLNEGNQSWCENASVLVIVISRKISYHKDRPQKSHAFEAGAAYENLALEATSRGYIAHAMGGFDKEKAHTMLKLSDYWSVDVMIAIGRFDEQMSKEKDKKPSDRIPLETLVFDSRLPEDFQ